MNELNSIQMQELSGGDAHNDWCATIGIGIIGISFVNPVAGAISGVLWIASCWSLA